ncbi:DUF4405 domain-containing protein [Ideonella sp. A 288]|uniref:DUF4405 domain-containing protein n=1 Tax=Ideonella sp. A 288 TaxID=1962181 RepID=UPI000B4AF66C|nr:DUF4405 domain-containing protein [Ideonella sp. A 288]
MIKVSREWATPVTVGVFVVMAVTGLLMFFHLDMGLNKAAHEWLGWLMVAAVAAHGWANWPSLRRHITASRRAQLVLGVSTVALAASFVVSGSDGPSPPLLAMQAIGRAPLKVAAPLAGKTLAQAQADLAAAGLPMADGDRSLQDLSGGDRRKMGLAVRTLLASAP